MKPKWEDSQVAPAHLFAPEKVCFFFTPGGPYARSKAPGGFCPRAPPVKSSTSRPSATPARVVKPPPSPLENSFFEDRSKDGCALKNSQIPGKCASIERVILRGRSPSAAELRIALHPRGGPERDEPEGDPLLIGGFSRTPESSRSRVFVPRALVHGLKKNRRRGLLPFQGGPPPPRKKICSGRIARPRILEETTRRKPPSVHFPLAAFFNSDPGGKSGRVLRRMALRRFAPAGAIRIHPRITRQAPPLDPLPRPPDISCPPAECGAGNFFALGGPSRAKPTKSCGRPLRLFLRRPELGRRFPKKILCRAVSMTEAAGTGGPPRF